MKLEHFETDALPPGGRWNDVADPADTLAGKADRIGILHSVIAQAKGEIESLRADLEDAGLKHIDGKLYRVTFAACAGATKVNWKAVAAKLKPSRQLIAAHTSVGKESIRMDVIARPTH